MTFCLFGALRLLLCLGSKHFHEMVKCKTNNGFHPSLHSPGVIQEAQLKVTSLLSVIPHTSNVMNPNRKVHETFMQILHMHLYPFNTCRKHIRERERDALTGQVHK